jgi:hypothetical protein
MWREGIQLRVCVSFGDGAEIVWRRDMTRIRMIRLSFAVSLQLLLEPHLV